LAWFLTERHVNRVEQEFAYADSLAGKNS
jgi:hypothetical protein